MVNSGENQKLLGNQDPEEGLRVPDKHIENTNTYNEGQQVQIDPPTVEKAEVKE